MFARVLAPALRSSRRWIFGLLLLAVAIGGLTYFLTAARPERSTFRPIRVVHDRPGGARVGVGATISEPEAILRLQRSFSAAPDCIAIMSKGYRDGAYILEAVNHCDATKSGRWWVNGKSGAVTRK